MNDPRFISIQDYHYDLPDDRIARYPLEQRDSSRLLIYEKGSIRGSIYRELASALPAGSMLVFNNSKVIEARLLFTKPTGGQIEIFCLEPHESYQDIQIAMQQTGAVKWLCLIGGASKWKPGQLLQKNIAHSNEEIILTAEFLEKRPGMFLVQLSWSAPSLSFGEILHLAGDIPLPPYIARDTEETDKVRYQTVYAKEQGSVAAPTAGLHFTEAIFNEISARQIPVEELSLHVGAGTFQPVKSVTMEGHLMHAEWIDVSRYLIENLMSTERQVIAVGTTSCRTLESLYWLGIKCGAQNGGPDAIPEVDQWDPYQLSATLSVKDSLKHLLDWMDHQNTDRLVTRTRLLIAPGYSFKLVKGLITNFHQPGSTLLLLVGALIGEDWKNIYQHAIDNGYRFLSYGDGCLLLPA